HRGVEALELDDAARQVLDQDALRGGNGDAGGLPALRVGDALLERVDARDEGCGQLGEEAAGVGEAAAVSAAFDEPGGEGFFEGVDLFPDGRLGEAEE